MDNIHCRNFPGEEKNGVIVHSYTNKDGTLNAIMKVVPEQQFSIRNNQDSRVSIGMENLENLEKSAVRRTCLENGEKQFLKRNCCLCLE